MSHPLIRIMIVENETAHLDMIKHSLQDAEVNFEIQTAGTLEEYRNRVVSHSPDIALIALNLTDGRATDVLTSPPEAGPFPILVMTGYGNEQIAVGAMKAGALDYLVKSQETFAEMPRIIARALREWDLLREHKRTEQVLRESELKFRALIENSADVISLLDANGRVLYNSAAYYRMMGYSPKKRIGQNTFDLVHPDERETLLHLFARILEKPGRIPLPPTRIRHNDGSWRWIEGIATNLLNEPGVNAIVVNYRDITERKRAEEVLEKSERKFAAAFYQGNIVMTFAELDSGRIIDVNDNFCECVGYSKSEVLGKTAAELGIFRDASTRRVMIETAKKFGSFKNIEIDFSRRNGEKRHGLFSGNIIELEGKPCLFTSMVDITERKQTEEALNQKTALLEAQLNSSIDGILVVDSQGKKILQNKRTVDLWKIPKEIADNPDDQMQVAHVMHLTKDPDQFVSQVKYLYSHPDETSRDEVELTDGTVLDRYSAPVVGSDGRYHGRIWSFRDITDRKRAEEQLRESEQLFRSLFEASPNAIMLLDPHDPHVSWPIVDCNEKACRMNGYAAREELIGQSIDVLNLTQATDEERADYLKQLREKDVVCLESFHRHKDGSIFPIEVSTSVVTVRNHELVLGIDRDITDRKRAEEALKESEERFRGIYENMTIGMYRTTPAGQIVMCNPALIQMLGYESFEDLAQRNLEKEGYEPKYDRKAFRERIENEGEIHGLESAWMQKDGTFIHVSESATAIKDTTGKVLYYEGTVEDISERKKAEGQIRKNLEEKEVLLKEIHHRVKNNLTVISSLLNLQARQIKTKQQALDAFKESRDRVFAMALVHEKLYQSHDFASVDMKSYLADMSNQLVRMYRVSQNVHLNLNVHEANIDINRAIPCGLILNELITNAFKHAFPDNREGEITVSFKAIDDASYELIVADDGVGLADDLDIENSPSLGLHLVRMLTSQLNGTWSVSREKGAAFRFVFPHKEA